MAEIVRINKINIRYGNDQRVFNAIVRKNPKFIKDIFALPESLFQNGLHYRSFRGERFGASLGELMPYLFHANFVEGIKAKTDLLKYTSNWFLDDAG